MAYKLTIPIYFARLKFISGEVFLLPLNDLESLKINVKSSLVAKKYADALQENRLNKGQYLSMLNEVHIVDYSVKKAIVSFPKSKNRFSFPAFSIEFTYLQHSTAQGFSSVVPVLGIEAYGKDEEDLVKRTEEAIKLEFSKEKRLDYVQNIIETLWFEEIEAVKEEMEVRIPTLLELEELEKKESQKLLPEVAKKVETPMPVLFGGDKWLQQLGRSLKSSFSRSVLLVGPSGVGKSTLVREAVRQQDLLGFEGEIWETTASTLIKELTKETGWQDHLATLAKELAISGTLLFIRNLADLFEVGQYEGNSVSMAEYLRGYISRGEIVLISECTPEEFAKIELKSPNFLSFFSIIQMSEPKGKDLKNIILEKVQSLSDHQKIDLKKSAVEEIIRLHIRFMPYSGFPGKPIRFIESIILNQKALQEGAEKITLTRAEIIRAFAMESGMPLFMIDPDVKMNLEQIKKQFNTQVYGQKLAINQMTDMLATVKTALARSNKPIASFLFVGPTGVGKTELGKVLADFMFGKRDKLVRFDMSEYSNPWEVMRLIGVGNGDGLLTSAVRRDPFSVILFDEIEKAAGNFYDLLLQVLSEGRLSDAQGKTVNFCSSIIIMTSNIGAQNFQNGKIGWSSTSTLEDINTHFESAVEKHFRPELYNRIDRIIPFAPLSQSVVRFIVSREMDLLRQREGIRFRNTEFNISEETLDYLSQKGYDEKYGARYLQREIHKQLITPLSHRLNEFGWDEQLVINIELINNQVNINIENNPLGLDLLLEELEKINNSDLSADLRRNLDSLFDSFTWLRFSDEITMLEDLKREQGDAFWTNGGAVTKYNELLFLKGKIQNLKTEMEELELNLGLVCLDLEKYSPKVSDNIENWQGKLSQTKLEMLSVLYPKRNTCTLAIYGSQQYLKTIYDLYYNTLIQRGYSVSGKTVWFRSSFYNEEILTEKLSDPTDENSETTLLRRQRQEYIYADIKKGFEKTPQKGDVLWGVELMLEGPSIHTYIQHEKDLQQWHVGDAIFNYFLKVEEGTEYRTPKDIHRKDFYKTSPRRTIKQGLFKDGRYKVETQEYSISTFLGEILDQLFVLAIEEEI